MAVMAPCARLRALPLVLGALAALATLLLAPAPARAGDVPFTAYGVGLEAGQVVAAYVDGQLCGETTVNEHGKWILKIYPTDPCAPSEGDAITFTLDGEAVSHELVEWSAGGAPPDVSSGIALSDGSGSAGSTTPPAEKTGTFKTVLVPGVNLTLWSGGDTAQLVTQAKLHSVSSVWIVLDGGFVGLVPGAPEFLNADFLSHFADGVVPAGTALVVVVFGA